MTEHTTIKQNRPSVKRNYAHTIWCSITYYNISFISWEMRNYLSGCRLLNTAYRELYIQGLFNEQVVAWQVRSYYW